MRRRRRQSFADRTTEFGARVFFLQYAIAGWFFIVMFGLGMLALVLGLLVGVLQRLGM